METKDATVEDQFLWVTEPTTKYKSQSEPHPEYRSFQFEPLPEYRSSQSEPFSRNHSAGSRPLTENRSQEISNIAKHRWNESESAWKSDSPKSSPSYISTASWNFWKTNVNSNTLREKHKRDRIHSGNYKNYTGGSYE